MWETALETVVSEGMVFCVVKRELTLTFTLPWLPSDCCEETPWPRQLMNGIMSLGVLLIVSEGEFMTVMVGRLTGDRRDKWG